MRHGAADLGDHAGQFAAGRKRQLRFGLVLVLDDQRIGEIHGCGMDIDPDLIGRQRRGFDILDHQCLRRAELFAEQGFHRIVIRGEVIPILYRR